jgi:hypothetical protein
MDMASVHGGQVTYLDPGDPLAVFGFMTETANLQVGAWGAGRSGTRV